MIQSDYYIEARDIAQKFRRRTLFRNVTLALKQGEALAITGRNGAGKSTLLQILAGISLPTRGHVSRGAGEELLEWDSFRRLLGFVSPRVNLYRECTGMENLAFVLGDAAAGTETKELLELFRLSGHENKALKTYSSGMAQRLKLIAVFAKNPSFLFLDEPGTNLDAEGKKTLYHYINKVKNNRVLIIATNEADEAALCGEVLSLDA